MNRRQIHFSLRNRWKLDYEIDALIADMMDADLKEQGLRQASPKGPRPTLTME